MTPQQAQLELETIYDTHDFFRTPPHSLSKKIPLNTIAWHPWIGNAGSFPYIIDPDSPTDFLQEIEPIYNNYVALFRRGSPHRNYLLAPKYTTFRNPIGLKKDYDYYNAVEFTLFTVDGVTHMIPVLTVIP